MMDCSTRTPGGKMTPANPETAAEFDGALLTVWSKYSTGVPLTRADLAALITATARLMREVR